MLEDNLSNGVAIRFVVHRIVMYLSFVDVTEHMDLFGCQGALVPMVKCAHSGSTMNLKAVVLHFISNITASLMDNHCLNSSQAFRVIQCEFSRIYDLVGVYYLNMTSR